MTTLYHEVHLFPGANGFIESNPPLQDNRATMPGVNGNNSRAAGDKNDGSTWADIDTILGPIEWDWRGWLAKGFLTILASEPGIGKSMLCLRMGACYLNGLPWPDGTKFTGERGKILWCESEAGQALNLERARDWGLDLTQIVIPLENPLHDFKLDNNQHKDALWAYAGRDDIRLIILDSLRGLHSKDENSSTTIDVVMWLAQLARNTGKPVLLTHHLRKRGIQDIDGRPTLDRLRGSSAIIQPARIVWALDVPDLNDPHNKRLSVIKNNLMRFSEPIGMKIDEDGVHFGIAPETPKEYTELDRAIDFLKDFLASEPVSAVEVEAEYRSMGFSKATMIRAKKRLGINSIKPAGETRWFWTLPIKP